MPPIEPEPSPWTFEFHTWPAGTDCVAQGADLEPGTILNAYRRGLFPMPHDDSILWWSPERRGVLQLDHFAQSRSLGKARKRFTVTVDQSFIDVIDGCADPSREGAWIDGPMRAAYIRLHAMGWAHSVETRNASGELAGGLYGLALGGLFCGESMFHRETDASKVALAALVDLLDDGVDRLIYVQWRTPHLASLGIEEWSRERYRDALEVLLESPLPEIWQ